MSEHASNAPRGIIDQTSMALLGRLWRTAIRPHGKRLALAGVLMVIVAAANAATAWLMDPVVNRLFIDQDRSMLMLVSGAVLATFLVKSAASFGQEALMAFTGQRIVADTQSRLLAHLLHQDVAALQASHSGTLLSRFTFDIQQMRYAVSSAVVALGRDSLTVIFLIAVMFYQQWLLACIALVVTPLTIYPIHRLGQRVRRITRQTQEEMGSLTASLAQSFQGIRTVKAFGMEGHERTRADSLIGRIFRLSFRAELNKAATLPLIDSVSGVAIAAVIFYGGVRVIEGVTTAGAFFSFITALLMAYQPMRALGKLNAQIQEGLAAAQRIFTLMDRQAVVVDPADPVHLERVPGAVRFQGVTFAYEDGAPALHDITFEAPAGRTTALVGPSGAGKSSIFNLIPRFYDAGSGRVEVNGHDVRAATLANLRDCIAVVSQDVMLFDDTVGDNIRYGRPDADEAEIGRAARAAAAEYFIEALPEGYRTIVGERGLRLSGGQRQRIAIARAILKDAPILLLDEATSALDTEAERQIQAALGGLMAGRTTIVIAHRLSTVINADVIHVLDQGRIVQSGSHAELIERGGLYARLYALQFADEADQTEALSPTSTR